MGNSNGLDEPIEDHGRIISTPGFCGGRPRIAGHRIRVQDVVLWHERLKMSVDEILLEYPSLDSGEIAAALTYYAEHRGEILDFLKEEDEFADAMERSHAPSFVRTPGYLDAKDDPVPPG